MKKFFLVLSAAGCILCGLQLCRSQAPSQYPIVDRFAEKVIQKYQSSSCQQLREQKQQPPDPQKQATEAKALQMLRNDPQMRQHFLNKVAGPIANKMFECGMIP